MNSVYPDSVWKYLGDESNAFHADPKVVTKVFLPENAADVRDILLECNRAGTCCTVSGAGTGITGSRVPLHGGIVLSTERLRHIEPRNGTEAVEYASLSGKLSLALNKRTPSAFAPAGISLDSLREALPPELFYPPDPTESTASLGGTVAANASGARSFYYGATRKWVRALEIVLADGETLSIKRGQIRADLKGRMEFKSNSGNAYRLQLPGATSPRIKNAAGILVQPEMDLVDLFIGSEGIFGVVVGMELSLCPKPAGLVANLTFFRKEENALAYGADLRTAKDRGVLSIEFFDGNSLRFMQGKTRKVDPAFEAAVFTEMIESESALEWLVELGQTHAAGEDWFAGNERETKELKEFRHALPEGVNSYLKRHQSSKLGTDFVVPPDRFAELMEFYHLAGRAFEQRFPRDGVHYVLFGHLGDCHLHFNFITHSAAELQFAKTLYADLALKAVALGGTISGEHGVGKKTISLEKRTVPYLQLMVGVQGLREIADMKAVLDPKGILNPGNVIGAPALWP